MIIIDGVNSGNDGGLVIRKYSFLVLSCLVSYGNGALRVLTNRC